MRVFLLEDRPTRNGVEFYNLLGRQCDLTVAFEGYPKEDNIWEFTTVGNSFKSVFLQGLNFGPNASIYFGIKGILNDNPYDVYVLKDCKTSAEKAVCKELLINGYKFVIASEGGFPEGIRSQTKSNKAKCLQNAYLYLSCGSACDVYLSSYGVNMEKVYRYNYAAFMEKDFLFNSVMSPARERGLKKRFGLKDNVFISVIDFSAEQGIDILLDIWKYAGIDDASLLIVSDARMQKKLHNMVKDIALNNVVMLDYQPRELTRELIKLSKAFIYPARYDAWGLPVVEALSCSTPVITSYSVGAAHDLVKDEKTGYINNINEPISWGECMRDTMERDVLYGKMRKNAINSMKAFTLESRVKTYMEVLKKCAITQKK